MLSLKTEIASQEKKNLLQLKIDEKIIAASIGCLLAMD